MSGELPPGLELSKRANTISGTPATAGTFTFTSDAWSNHPNGAWTIDSPDRKMAAISG